MFKPTEILKLTSITLGPFLVNPDYGRGMKIELKIFDFNKENIFDKAFLDPYNRVKMDNLSPRSARAKLQPTHYTQRAVYDKSTGKYYLLIVFNSLIAVTSDICIKIKTI